MNTILLEEAASTNSWIKANEDKLTPPVVVRAVAQTAGRGQRGNHWESAPGENLTLSLLWRPEAEFPAREQFAVSEAVSCAVVSYLQSRGVTAMVKWPNDIYVGDKKICGILIENSLLGAGLMRCIIGIGLNVNQKEFYSDAPNPVSMSQITGRNYSLDEETEALVGQVGDGLSIILSMEGRREMHTDYHNRLWRYADGAPHKFRDVKKDKVYSGEIIGVEPEGMLAIRDIATGDIHQYWFKEVEYLL